MGTISNELTTKAYENVNAPGLDWRKSSRTDLDPILKDCVILADAGVAKDFGHAHVPDDARLVAMSDDKTPGAPVLTFTRAEISKFLDGVQQGEFDEFRATDEELQAAAESATV